MVRLRKPSARVAWVLLTVAVCFNVFFLVGYWHSFRLIRELQTPGGRMMFVARQLGLSGEQTERLMAVRRRIGEELIAFQEANMDDIDHALALLLQEGADLAELHGRLGRLLDARRDVVIRVFDQLHEFLVTLTPEQQDRFERFVRERHMLH